MATDVMKLAACVLAATTAVQQLMDSACLVVMLDGGEKLVNMVAIKEHTATAVMKRAACVSAVIRAVQRLMECARMAVKLDGGEERCNKGTYSYGCNETCGMCLTGNDSCSTTDGQCKIGCDAGWSGETCKHGS
ncbi:hypothetical protein CHS0354_040088 [Potamilus streckersoni]|uniref:Antifreeze protein n=1 Tax=Potamilus streckersoni TaxID=2493646 RepID=A0AAE0ST23_9BIVA|nr:hypothetical protein CHS0354_040088 [Potamilus streckersoni]